MLNDKNLKRVFIHELGHLVAHNLIFSTFGFHEIEKVEIKGVRFTNEYIGKTVPLKPKNYDKQKDFVLNLPEVFCEFYYGCIFQTIYLQTPFVQCFNLKGNGKDDFQAINGELINRYMKSGIDYRKTFNDLLSIVNQHLEKLPKIELRNILEELKPQDYLKRINDKFEFKLNELKPNLKIIEDLVRSEFLKFNIEIKEYATQYQL